MILENEFYTIIDRKDLEKGFAVKVELNPEHVIYRAHFPGKPVTPGVCLLAIIQELLEKKLCKNLRLLQAKNIKFLNILDPFEHQTVYFHFRGEYLPGEPSLWEISANDGETVFSKMSVTYL